MIKTLLLSSSLLFTSALTAQKVDGIFFHLYTDSLKKGVHNYINVDGKLSNGQWMPLTAKELDFSSSYGRFEGNSLIIDTGYKGEKVIVKAVLKSNPSIAREITIYIKKSNTEEKLKTVEEILGSPPRKNRRNKKAIP